MTQLAIAVIACGAGVCGAPLWVVFLVGVFVFGYLLRVT